MKPSESLDIKTFGTELEITLATNTIDIYTRFRGYWKSCVIRNTQAIDALQYRTEPNAPLKTVQPNSELPVQGWGSFFQVISAAAVPEGRVEFAVALQGDALNA